MNRVILLFLQASSRVGEPSPEVILFLHHDRPGGVVSFLAELGRVCGDLEGVKREPPIGFGRTRQAQ